MSDEKQYSPLTLILEYKPDKSGMYFSSGECMNARRMHDGCTKNGQSPPPPPPPGPCLLLVYEDVVRLNNLLEALVGVEVASPSLVGMMDE